MIERVLKIVGLYPKNEKSKLHYCPVYQILDKDMNRKPRKQKCNYRYKVGFLSYIQAMIQPEITMPV